MKRFLAFFLCAAMLVVAAVGVSANATYSETEPTGLGTLIVKKTGNQDEVTEFSGSVVNLKSGGDSFCPKADCWVRYEFTAEKAGTYTFVIEYVARTGTDRGLDYAIDTTDASKRVFLDLEQSADHRFATVTEELEAGTHSFYFFCPTGFDDSSLKSCDVYGWAAYFTKEAPAAVDVTENAPSTADTAVIACVALAVSATAAIIVTRKRRGF